MRKCVECGESFDYEDARDYFDYYFNNEISYDDQFPEGRTCDKCAITITESLMQAGRDAVDP